MKTLDSENNYSNASHSQNHGRLEGVNRFGEENIIPDTYEDLKGLRHFLEKHEPGVSWSKDPRSESFGEKTHFGKGPKNFKRSDERIRDEICHSLTLHHEIDPSNIEVTVKEGLVTLTGKVNTKIEKWAAEDLLDDVVGIREVYNYICVRKSMHQEDEPGGLIKGLK